MFAEIVTLALFPLHSHQWLCVALLDHSGVVARWLAKGPRIGFHLRSDGGTLSWAFQCNIVLGQYLTRDLTTLLM